MRENILMIQGLQHKEISIANSFFEELFFNSFVGDFDTMQLEYKSKETDEYEILIEGEVNKNRLISFLSDEKYRSYNLHVYLRNVITSYSIHYTKLYEKKFEGEKLQDIKAKKFISSVEAVIKDPEKLKKFLNGVKDDIPLTDLFKGIKSEREKGLLLIEATNPELVQLIRKNKLPSSMVKEKYRDLLKYLDDFDFSKYKNLGDVESKFRKGFYAHYVQIIPDKPSLLTEFLQPFRQGFGSVAEHYILQERIIRILYKIPKNIEVNIIKPILDKSETFKNLKGNTVNFQPDGLFSSFISGNKHKNVVSFLIEVKAGYTNGGISETQIENYIILLDMILKKKEGYKEILSNLSSSTGIKDIESFSYNFV